MSRWRLTVLSLVAASSQSAWGASATLDSMAGAPVIFSNTEYVEGLAATETTLWAATRGGVEEYDLDNLKRRKVWTTSDGLPTTAIRGVVIHEGSPVALAGDSRCTLQGNRFSCVSATPASPATPAPLDLWRSSRVTASLVIGSRRFVGTADQGLWLDGKHPRRLTPTGQLCGNHVVAVAEYGSEVWLGTFDEGLCRFDGKRFVTASVPFRMVNDLASTPHGLYVATTSGLFRTRDGRRFESVPLFDTRSINSLAVDGDTLWATNPAVLWRIPLGRRGRPKGYWQPGGTRSLQAVDAVAGVVWLASEDRGLMRKHGRRFEVFDRAAGLPTSWMVDVAGMPDGAAYGATLRHGLVRVGATGAVDSVPGIPDAWLLRIGREDGGLWLGTQGGAARIEGKAMKVFAGLPNPCVHGVHETATGIWVGTEGGVALYPRSPAHAP
jgi:ligand-binding sensor domain-containing protein